MRSPRRLIATLVGALLLTMAAVPAPAVVAATTPVVKVRPVVSGFSVTVGYSIDRPAAAIAKQICWLRDPARVLTKVACDKTPEPSSTTTLTRFRRTLPVTKAGANAFLVRFTLTNGRQVLGGRSFTVTPGPAVRFSVSGLFSQTIRCDSSSCPGDWVQDVARQVVKVTARDQHGNVAKGYDGTVQFDGFATTVKESTLTNGVGWFAVRPTGLQLNMYNDCAAGTPGNANYEVALVVTDKVDPSIRGCQMIRYEIYFVLDPLPIFRIPVITPEGCTDGCLVDPTGTVVADTEARPIEVIEIDEASIDKVNGSIDITIGGKTTDEQAFLQVIGLENVAAKTDDLPQAMTDKCTGCSQAVWIAASIPATIINDTRPTVEVRTVDQPMTVSGMELYFPGFGKTVTTSARAVPNRSARPVCYAYFDVAFSFFGNENVPCRGAGGY